MHDHSHGPGPGHAHAHQHDQGLGGLVHYLRLIPVLWRSELGAEVVRALAPKSGERVVDLGAGMGSATVEAARTGASVVAVDPAPYMRWTLRLRFRLPGRGRVTVLDGAAESLPVADGSVDALWSVNTLHHWTDRARATRELARVLRPGGRVLLVDEDLDDPAHPLHGRAKRWHRFEQVDPEALASALLAEGFSSAEGGRSTFAGRPARVIRAVR